jgi:hypothetical protein
MSETNHRHFPSSSLEGRQVLASHPSVDGIWRSHGRIWLVDAADRPARLIRADRRDQSVEERDAFIALSRYHPWRVGAGPLLTLPVPWPAVKVHRICHIDSLTVRRARSGQIRQSRERGRARGEDVSRAPSRGMLTASKGDPTCPTGLLGSWDASCSSRPL